MRRRKNALGRKNEQGFIITLVAVFMLGVVGAMAALSIDLVTIYTARSEAQLAADSAALAAARVLANSGATSDTTGASMSSAWTVAQAVALQVAEQNTVGGVTLTSAQQPDLHHKSSDNQSANIFRAHLGNEIRHGRGIRHGGSLQPFGIKCLGWGKYNAGCPHLCEAVAATEHRSHGDYYRRKQRDIFTAVWPH